MTNPPNNPWEWQGQDQGPNQGGWPPPGGEDYPPPPPPPPPGGYPPPGSGYPPPPPPPPPPGGGYPGGGYPGPGGGYPGPGGGYPPPGTYPGGSWGSEPGTSRYGELAGWWSRVGATLIDMVVLGVPAFLLIFATGGSVGARSVVDLVILVGQAAYFTLMISSRGQTVGNMAVGTRVVDARTGGPLSTGRALGRWASELLFWALIVAFFIPTLLDFLWPLWDRQNQTLHDKMVGTVVLYSATSS